MPDRTPHRATEDFRLNLNDLADPRDVRHTLQETAYLGRLVAPDLDGAALERAFDAAARLHTGNYPQFPAGADGFRRLEAACAVTLAAMRLMHGAHVMGHRFEAREVLLLALAALLHDPGDGHGGPAVGNPAFALDHLSMDGFPASDGEDCAALIRCADPAWSPEVPGGTGLTPEEDTPALAGRMLATAVVLAVMGRPTPFRAGGRGLPAQPRHARRAPLPGLPRRRGRAPATPLPGLAAHAHVAPFRQPLGSGPRPVHGIGQAFEGSARRRHGAGGLQRRRVLTRQRLSP